MITQMFSKKIKSIGILFRRELLRDHFLLEIKRWFQDRGDQTLRLNYPLNENSIVFDVGGYLGDFAFDINKKYDCRVYLFEPVEEFYVKSKARFADNKKIQCYQFGLASENGEYFISQSEDASSFARTNLGGDKVTAKTKSILSFCEENNVQHIDLIKINIEGGEFDLLPAILNSSLIKRIHFLQIQFHDFIKNAKKMRDDIRLRLAQTHNEAWCYEFVWESWSLKKDKNL